MTRCPSERRLLDCVLGVGAAAVRMHLRECADCAERQARMEEELADVATVLRDPPRVRRVAPAIWPIPRWVPALVVLAFASIAILAIVRTRSADTVEQAMAVTNTLDFSRDLVTALFADPASLSSLTIEPAEDAYLEAALEGEWPCTDWQAFEQRCAGPVYSVLQDE